jgi:hypothetical protein
MERIFLLSGIWLVTWIEYSCCLASDRSHGENLPVVWHLIGHMERIFLLSGIWLVTWREYSCCLASDWSHGENIPVVWHLIGHTERIFLIPSSYVLSLTVLVALQIPEQLAQIECLRKHLLNRLDKIQSGFLIIFCALELLVFFFF